MDVVQTLILSVIEGITEFLPVSSTGHLVLTAYILNIPQTGFVKSFEIIIQLGAIGSVIFLYRKTLIKNIEIWKRIIIAFLPTATIGFVLYKIIKHVLIGNEYITLLALFLGGIALIFFELLHKEKTGHKEKIEDLSLNKAFFIGVCQSLSVIPGVSRAAATILGGLSFGLKRKTAVEFSFLLAIPTMLAATVLDLKESNFSFSTQEWMLLALGFTGSFIVALVVVKWFMQFIQNNSFIPFGIYRIFLSILYFLFVLRP